MHKNKFALTAFVAALVLSMLACSLGAQPTPTTAPTNTPIPTNTAAPTNTPEPTNTPKPTETVAPPPAKDTEAPTTSTGGETGDHVVPAGELGVGLRTSWKDSFGGWNISGLVVNNADRSYDGVEIEIEIFDANEKSVYKDSTYMSLWGIAPGEISPFSMYVSESDAPGAESFTATIVGQSPAYEEIARPEYSLENIITATDDSGYAYLTGEVVNHSDKPMLVRSLASALFDADKQLLTADAYSTQLSYIEPGKSGPFRVTIQTPPDATLDNYVIYPDVIETEPVADYDISVSQDASNYLDTSWFNSYHVVGSVTNNTDKWMSVTLVAALYDKDGKVLDVATGYLPFSAIAAGETLPFDVTSNWGPVNNIDGYFDENADNVKWWIDPNYLYESSFPSIALETTDDASSVEDDSIKFTGKVSNGTEKTMSSVVVSVAIYEKSSGKLLAANYTYLWDELAANGTGDYEVTVYLPAGTDPDAVDTVILAKGQEK
jgi:hypothetical protein